MGRNICYIRQCPPVPESGNIAYWESHGANGSCGVGILMTKEKGFPWHLCHVPRPLGCSTGSVSPSIAFSGFPKYQPLRLQLFSEIGTFGVLMRSCRRPIVRTISTNQRTRVIAITLTFAGTSFPWYLCGYYFYCYLPPT